MHDKRDRFVSLAEKRVTKAINALHLIGNLANRHNYSYTAGDVQKIVDTLDLEFKLLKTRFVSEKGRGKTVFKL